MSYPDITFDVTKDVLNYGVRVCVLVMSGIQNRESDPDFEKLRDAVCQKILDGLSDQAIRDDQILQKFREMHMSLGFSNRNFPAASETLLEFLLRNRRPPSINLLVDIYNLVSLETRLALGAHDLANISGNVHLRTTIGDEGFVPLGSVERKKVRPGGYAYIDGANDVICLLEVKQVEKTKVVLDTTECLFIVQGNVCTEYDTIRSAADRLIDLTQHFCGGQVRFL
ncbi:MAG: phenylalanine--tRNA ligase beta subunit-related protein [Anaerolineaceae bacterium]|nr:phenylalanine--tRNA ligase beta subunit-related protein [Anaerolineaceae bacterium]